MTLEEIRTATADMLTPADIAPILGSDPQTIRLAAQTNPACVGFPFTMIGNRMKIPREGFLYWMTYGNAIAENNGKWRGKT